MTALTLEAQVTRLAAIEDIKQLKARYAEYCDNGYDPDGIARLFVEDGVWDGGPGYGRHEGRASISAFFSRLSNDVALAAHLSMNPIIEVNGDGATGRWRLLCPYTLATEGGKQARWIVAQYDEIYEKHGERWLYRALNVNVNFDALHQLGWVRTS
jgi:hypothetical protein